MKSTNSRLFFTTFLSQTVGKILVFDVLGAPDELAIESRDVDQLGRFADEAEEPWVDLVTDHGEAIGRWVPGNAAAVTPQPSFPVQEGMIYLLGGDPLLGEEQGLHQFPLEALSYHGGKDLEELKWFRSEDLVISTPASLTEITLMRGRRAQQQYKWKPIKATFGQFSEELMNHRVGDKDGTCFLQGESANGTRKAAAMIKNDVLAVDIDYGPLLSDLLQKTISHELQAAIFTTHSHLKNTSAINRDHFLARSGSSAIEADAVRNYLINVRGMPPGLAKDLEIVDDAHHSEEGVVIVVRHQPIPKYRVVFPLKKPFVFAKRGGPQKEAIAEWKERYAGVCTELDLFYDESCTDPARLFYFPRHAKGREWASWIIWGDPLDLDKYDRIQLKRGKDGRRGAPTGNPFTAAGGSEDHDEDANRYLVAGLNLKAWAAKHARRFEIQTMLEDVIGGDFIRHVRSSNPGVHVECPFEAEHSSFGGNGTFVVNASDNFDMGFEGGFTFTCAHNACAGRDRLDFLKALVEADLITTTDLTDEAFLISLE